MKYVDFKDHDLDLLISKDKTLGDFILNFPKIKRRKETDPFYSLVRSIIGQLISTKTQENIIKKFKKITPEYILSLSNEEMNSYGIPLKKISWIKELANKIINKELDLDSLKELSDEEVINELTKLNGIGVWTAEMFLIFNLNRLNVLSFGDLGVRRGIEKLYNIEKLDKKTFNYYKDLYSPYNTIAALYLWEYGRLYTKSYYKTDIGYILLTMFDDILLELHIRDELPSYTNEKNVHSDKVYKEIKEYLNGLRSEFTIKYKLSGSDFQIKVWNELLKIPYGETRSYKDIAININNSDSQRAVGGANNKNKISIIVPCHRVIGANNKLVGYGGGLDKKERLLNLEKKYYEKYK